jgi:hypothetical protein
MPEAIRDEDALSRRLGPDSINPDGTVNSNAYKLGGKPASTFSVDLARLTTPEESIGRAPRPGFGLGVIPAGVLRQLGFTVRHAPEGGNDAHCQVEGPASRQSCRLLAEATRVLIPPS